jgi:hypothetical protein
MFVFKGLSFKSETGPICPLKCLAFSPILPVADASNTATALPLNDEVAN